MGTTPAPNVRDRPTRDEIKRNCVEVETFREIDVDFISSRFALRVVICNAEGLQHGGLFDTTTDGAA